MKYRLDGRGGDPVIRRVLNAIERQQEEIRHVRQKVERDHERRAPEQRTRDVAFRFLHLPGRKGDAFPGNGGKQRTHLRDAEGDEQAEPARRRDGRKERQIRPDRRHAPRRP